MSSLLEDIRVFMSGSGPAFSDPIDTTYVPGRREMKINSGFIEVQEYVAAAKKFGLVDADPCLWDAVSKYVKMKIGLPLQFYSSKSRWPKLFYPPSVTIDQFQEWVSKAYNDRDWVFLASLIIYVDGVLCPPVNHCDVGRAFASSQSFRNQMLKGKVTVPEAKQWVLGVDAVTLPDKFCFHVSQMDSSSFTPSNPMYEQFPDKLIKDITAKTMQTMTKGTITAMNMMDLDFQGYAMSEVYQVSKMHLLKPVLGLSKISKQNVSPKGLEMYEFAEDPIRSPFLKLTGTVNYDVSGLVIFHTYEEEVSLTTVISKGKRTAAQVDETKGYGSFYIKLPLQHDFGDPLDVIPRDVNGEVCVKQLCSIVECVFSPFTHKFPNGHEEMFWYSIRNGVLHAFNYDSNVWQPIKFNRCLMVKKIQVLTCGKLKSSSGSDINYTVSKTGELFLGLSPSSNYIASGQLPQITAIYSTDDLPLIKVPEKLRVVDNMCLWWIAVNDQNLPKWIPAKKLPSLHPLYSVNNDDCPKLGFEATLVGNDVFLDLHYDNGVDILHIMCPKTALVHLPHLLTQQLILQLWRQSPRFFAIDTAKGFVTPDDVLVEAPESVVLASPRDVFIHYPDTATMQLLPDEIKLAINKSTMFLYHNTKLKVRIQNVGGVLTFTGPDAHKLNPKRGLWIELKFATEINTAICNAFGNPNYLAEGQLFLCGSLNALSIDSQLTYYPFVKFIPGLINHIYECRNEYKNDVSFANEQFNASYFSNTHVLETFDEITSWCDEVDEYSDEPRFQYTVNQEILVQEAKVEGMLSEDVVDFLTSVDPSPILNSRPDSIVSLMVEDVHGLQNFKTTREEDDAEEQGDCPTVQEDDEYDYLLDDDDNPMLIDTANVSYTDEGPSSNDIETKQIDQGGQLVQMFISRRKMKYVKLVLKEFMAEKERRIKWVTGEMIKVTSDLVHPPKIAGQMMSPFIPNVPEGNIVVAMALFHRFILPHLNRGSNLFIRYKCQGNWYVAPKPFKFMKNLNSGKQFSQTGRPNLLEIPSAVQVSTVVLPQDVEDSIMTHFLPLVGRFGHVSQLYSLVNNWKGRSEPESWAVEMFYTYCANHVLFRKGGPWLERMGSHPVKWLTWQGTVTGLRYTLNSTYDVGPSVMDAGWHLIKYNANYQLKPPDKPSPTKETNLWVFKGGEFTSRIQQVADINEICGDELKITNGFRVFLMSLKMFAQFHMGSRVFDKLCYYSGTTWHTDQEVYVNNLMSAWPNLDLAINKLDLLMKQFNTNAIEMEVLRAPLLRSGLAVAVNDPNNRNWVKSNVLLLWFKTGPTPGVWMSHAHSWKRRGKVTQGAVARVFIATWNDALTLNSMKDINKFLNDSFSMEPILYVKLKEKTSFKTIEISADVVVKEDHK